MMTRSRRRAGLDHLRHLRPLQPFDDLAEASVGLALLGNGTSVLGKTRSNPTQEAMVEWIAIRAKPSIEVTAPSAQT
ncbi:hypothetical protein [Inquilinus sp.]|jgi:hypothetical protein|uniref:hypothetical protein n=1 Tax=Inquilinus sp. TaxID=1932117 RepID=UPI003784E491